MIMGAIVGSIFPGAGTVLGAVIMLIRSIVLYRKETAPERRQRRLALQQQRQAEEERQRRQAQEDEERKMRQARELAEIPRREQVSRERESAQRSRDDARARVAIFFNLHAPELGNRFTRTMLDEFVSRYMGDDKAPEDVASRAEQLSEVIRQHLTKVQPAAEFLSLESVLAAYAARKKKIQHSDLDPRDKETLLIQLDEHRERDVSSALREGRV